MIRSRVMLDGRVMIAPLFKLSFEFQIDARRPECKCGSRGSYRACGAAYTSRGRHTILAGIIAVPTEAGGSPNEHAKAAVRRHRSIQGHAAIIAARLYVEFRSSRRRLYARCRPGAR